MNVDAFARLLKEGYIEATAIKGLVYCPCLGYWINQTEVA